MEFWLDARKIAYTTESDATSFAFDVWENRSLAGLPFKRSASFMLETDARFYLTAKYPGAVEKLADAEEVASSPTVPRPTPPHDLRDDDAWRKYREDSRRYRVAMSEDAA